MTDCHIHCFCTCSSSSLFAASDILEIFMRCHTDVFFENEGKKVVIIEACFVCNLRKRESSVPCNRVLYPIFIHILHKGHSEILLKQLAEITLVISKIIGYFFRCQICPEMLLYIQLDRMNKLNSPFNGFSTLYCGQFS